MHERIWTKVKNIVINSSNTKTTKGIMKNTLAMVVSDFIRYFRFYFNAENRPNMAVLIFVFVVLGVVNVYFSEHCNVFDMRYFLILNNAIFSGYFEEKNIDPDGFDNVKRNLIDDVNRPPPRAFGHGNVEM